MRIYKTKWFARFARKNGMDNKALAYAMHEIGNGLHDGDLGGGLIKKRVARRGQGKRGGFRTILVYRKGKRAVFLYGFAKSVMENISVVELKAFQKLAALYLEFDDADMAKAVKADELQEVMYGS